MYEFQDKLDPGKVFGHDQASTVLSQNSLLEYSFLRIGRLEYPDGAASPLIEFKQKLEKEWLEKKKDVDHMDTFQDFLKKVIASSNGDKVTSVLN